jgi:hypothetical protein
LKRKHHGLFCNMQKMKIGRREEKEHVMHMYLFIHIFMCSVIIMNSKDKIAPVLNDLSTTP